MNSVQRKTVGILGGKGPEATVDLFRLIVENTPVKREEDHLRIIVDCHPQIPKCALGITGEGPDSLPALTESARILEQAGADLIAIPCNSAHFYLEQLRATVSIPFRSIITATVAAVRSAALKRVGLLATTGLIQSEIYQKGFEEAGIEIVTPEPAEQRELMDGILRFKDKAERTPLQDRLDVIGNRILSEGNAEALVLACTELPIVIRCNHFAALNNLRTRTGHPEVCLLPGGEHQMTRPWHSIQIHELHGLMFGHAGMDSEENIPDGA